MAKKNRRTARYVRETEVREAAERLAARRARGARVDPGRIPPYPEVLREADGTYRDFFEDIQFTCCDCGSEQVWTAADQKWWFEVAGGSLYSGPARCVACRAARRRADGRTDARRPGTTTVNAEPVPPTEFAGPS